MQFFMHKLASLHFRMFKTCIKDCIEFFSGSVVEVNSLSDFIFFSVNLVLKMKCIQFLCIALVFVCVHSIEDNSISETEGINLKYMLTRFLIFIYLINFRHFVDSL